MKLSDKPSFMRYDYSVSLDSFKHDQNDKKRHISRPLTSWREKVKSFQSEISNQLEKRIHLVCLVSLNLNNNHFTLLEINEIEERIYHYNSITSKNIINDTDELSHVSKIVQVS